MKNITPELIREFCKAEGFSSEAILSLILNEASNRKFWLLLIHQWISKQDYEIQKQAAEHL